MIVRLCLPSWQKVRFDVMITRSKFTCCKSEIDSCFVSLNSTPQMCVRGVASVCLVFFGSRTVSKTIEDALSSLPRQRGLHARRRG